MVDHKPCVGRAGECYRALRYGVQGLDDLGQPPQHVRHRCWDYLLTRLAFMVTAVNILLQWHGLPADEQGLVHLSMAEFSL